jgi:hypothetical protein
MRPPPISSVHRGTKSDNLVVTILSRIFQAWEYHGSFIIIERGASRLYEHSHRPPSTSIAFSVSGKALSRSQASHNNLQTLVGDQSLGDNQHCACGPIDGIPSSCIAMSFYEPHCVKLSIRAWCIHEPLELTNCLKITQLVIVVHFLEPHSASCSRTFQWPVLEQPSRGALL